MGEGARAGGDQAATDQATGRRMAIPEAAEVLGITADAVRSRIKRGTLPTVRESGRVFVVMGGAERPTAQAQPTNRPGDEPLYREMKERIRYLERQVEEEREARRRADTLLARLMDRMPELEALPESVTKSTPRTGPQDVARHGATAHQSEDASDQAVADEYYAERERMFWLRYGSAAILALFYISILGAGLAPVIANFIQVDQGGLKDYVVEGAEPYLVTGEPSLWGSFAFALFLLPISYGFISGTGMWRNLLTSSRFGPVLPLRVPVSLGLGAAIVLIVGIVLSHWDVFIGGSGWNASNIYFLIVSALLMFLVASLFTLFAMFMGLAWARQRTSGSDEGRNGGWTPRKQAMVGLIGSIITALVTFSGVVLQVLAGKGGG